MSVVEEVLEKQHNISNLVKHGDWAGSYVAYKEMEEFKKKYLQERSNMIRNEIIFYCKFNKITLEEFCVKYGFEIYYLKKVMAGLIRPSEYFLDRIIKVTSKVYDENKI